MKAIIVEDEVLAQEELSYLIRSRNVPGRRGTLKQEQEEELAALNMDE